jgi:hypothetical protein
MPRKKAAAKPAGGNINAYVPTDVIAMATKAASKLRMTRSEYVAACLRAMNGKDPRCVVGASVDALLDYVEKGRIDQQRPKGDCPRCDGTGNLPL